VDGRRERTEWIEAASRGEAEVRLAGERKKFQERAKRRSRGLAEVVTFSTLLSDFERDEFPALSEGGRNSYRDSFKVFQPVLSWISSAIRSSTRSTVTDVKSYLRWRRAHSLRKGRTVGAHTVQRDRRVLHRLFAYAVEDLEVIKANPVPGSKKAGKPDEREYVILENDAMARLLDSCEDAMVRLYVLFLAETGARSVSEGLHLRWEDIDLSDGFARIVSGRDGHRTKSGKSRHVPLTPRLIEALRDHAAAYRLATYHGERSPWLFHYTHDRRAGKAGGRVKSFRAEIGRSHPEGRSTRRVPRP
jgi:integrase